MLSGFPRAGKPTINDSVVVVKALSTKHSWYVVTSGLHAQGQLQSLAQTRSADATIAVAAASTATGVGFMQVAEE